MNSACVIISPQNITLATPAVIGGKGSNLAHLQRIGQPVPEWYGISTQLMGKIVGDSCGREIEEHLASLSPHDAAEKVAGISRQLMALVEATQLPQATIDFLKQNHQELLAPDTFVSVRSSAVDEDSSGASFAGLHDSFLYIRDIDGVVEAIKKVWASAYTTRALMFRLENQISLADIRIGVIVQKMVAATISGIMFTANPNNGNVREVLISSLYGAGEGIVSAGLDADLYIYTKKNGAISEELTTKDEQLVFDTEKQCGIKRLSVAPDLQRKSSLSPQQIREIAQAGLIIEKSYGKPQDIEFSLDAAGHLFILQARPITTIKEYGPAAGNCLIWDNSNIIESYSGPTTPMTFSFIRHAYTIVYHCFSQVMGISAQDVHKNRHVFENMLGIINGQVYYNIINWYRLVKLFPGFNYNKAFMESMMGLADKVDLDEPEEQPASFFQRYFVELPKLVQLLGRSIVNFRRISKLVQQFNDHFNHHYQAWTKLDFDRLPPHELMAIYREMEEKLLWNWKTPIINDFYVMIYYGILKKFCTKWCGDETGSLQNDLICGEGDIESTKPTKLLMALARFIKSNEKYVRLFHEKDHYQLAKIIPAQEEYRDIADRITDYLTQYGFRCINELKLEEPSLHETPEFVYQIIRNYLQMDDATALDPAVMEKREQQIRARAEATAAKAMGSSLSGIIKKALFHWVLKRARNGVKNRENMRFARTKIYGLLRQLLNSLGTQLATEGVLQTGHDIYFLTLDEVWDFIKGTAVTTNLKGLVELRRKEFAFYTSAEAPMIDDHFETFGMVYHRNLFQKPSSKTPPTEGDGLRGIGCSPGRISGQVKIVQSPRDNLQLKGEILVAGRTDPGWVPLYPAVSGILIERGSILSHSAIVAREMGIPTIVGIPNLMQLLKDGQVVTMDGSTGEIKVHE
jgi:pyruvate,water dikinase